MAPSLCSGLPAIEFGEAIGLDRHHLPERYCLSLFRWVGCIAGHHRSDIFGDEIAFGPRIDAVDLLNAPAMLGFLLGTVGVIDLPWERAAELGVVLATGVQRSGQAEFTQCQVAPHFTDELGFDRAICGAPGHVFERWDGQGEPGAVQGVEIARSTGIMHLTIEAELFFRLGGRDAVQSVVSIQPRGVCPCALRAVSPSRASSNVLGSGLVSVEHIHRGTHRGPFMGLPATGRAIEAPGIEMFGVRDGKVWEIWH